ncbi:hypothetical protein ACFV4T_15280 [Streptomyces sp. NPDC059755]|uniref:TRADD-N-associated membrane domain-containing protein n=1 Tax=Streptomyces sp. NPDC059755 TaxID=3346934 RepID=UPI00366685C4
MSTDQNSGKQESPRTLEPEENQEPPPGVSQEILDSDSAQQLLVGSPSDFDRTYLPRYRFEAGRRLEREWLKSTEGKAAIKKSTRLRNFSLGIFVICLSVSVALILLEVRWRTSLVVFTFGALICAGGLAIARTTYRSARRAFIPSEPDQRVRSDQKSGRWLRDLDLQNLIVLNREQMKRYDDIATQQAKMAGRSSNIAMGVGFAALITGAILALRVPSDTAKVVVASLAAVGTAVSTFISKTFFEAQKRAMSQMNYYFEQPLVMSYMLAAERVSNGLEEDAGRHRDLIASVVRRMLDAAHNAYARESGELLSSQQRDATSIAKSGQEEKESRATKQPEQ